MLFVILRVALFVVLIRLSGRLSGAGSAYGRELSLKVHRTTLYCLRRSSSSHSTTTTITSHIAQGSTIYTRGDETAITLRNLLTLRRSPFCRRHNGKMSLGRPP